MESQVLPSDLDVDLPELQRQARFGRDGYYAMKRQGRTPRAYRIGRKLWFSRAEVQQWLATERIQAPTQSRIGQSQHDAEQSLDPAHDPQETSGEPPGN